MINEPHFHVDPHFVESLSAYDHVYLRGYWQSEKYFESHDNIRRDLTPQESHHPLQDPNSVSIHFRFNFGLLATGETAQKAVDIHGVNLELYYQKAIKIMLEKRPDANFYIFGDDIKKSEAFIKTLGVSYTIPDPSVQDYQDMLLISGCQHHIIANSTFSWWGAWLCAHDEKIVIAPEKWFNNAKMQTQDLIPAAWIRV